MKVRNAIVKEWFNCGNQQLIDHMDVDPTLASVAVVRLCEVDRYALGLHDWFPYSYRRKNMSHDSRSAPVVRKLANGNMEMLLGLNQSVLFIG